MFYFYQLSVQSPLRVGVTKKRGLGKIPKGGGGLKKKDENSQFQFGNCDNPGGRGVSIFQKRELREDSDTKLEIRLNLAYFNANIHFLRRI